MESLSFDEKFLGNRTVIVFPQRLGVVADITASALDVWWSRVTGEFHT